MTMTWPELVEQLLTRLEAQGENMSTERAEFGVLMVDCCMKGCPLIEKDIAETEKKLTT